MGQLLGKLDILYAEYDGEDFSLFLEAVQENGFSSNIQRVNDGQELVDFFISEETSNLPKLIISDLNMPKKNGLEAVREIRKKSLLSRIPIIIFSDSKCIEEVQLSYDLGVNSFIQKPLSYQEHLQCIKNIHNFWLQTAQLP
jgi:CheY-like chemotaxis protein